MQPKHKIDPMKTWPVTELPKGQQPPGGRLQRSTRLRKKFYKWWIQKIVPPFNIGEAVNYMVKNAISCNWDVVDKAMKTMELDNYIEQTWGLLCKDMGLVPILQHAETYKLKYYK